jgi:hypothetical protein
MIDTFAVVSTDRWRTGGRTGERAGAGFSGVGRPSPDWAEAPEKFRVAKQFASPWLSHHQSLFDRDTTKRNHGNEAQTQRARRPGARVAAITNPTSKRCISDRACQHACPYQRHCSFFRRVSVGAAVIERDKRPAMELADGCTVQGHTTGIARSRHSCPQWNRNRKDGRIPPSHPT